MCNRKVAGLGALRQLRGSALQRTQPGHATLPLNKQLKKKRSSFAILGFLANGPKSGYEIKRAITERTSFFWNESFGQIYPMLGQLEGLGLIEKGEVESVGRRSSQRYAITPEGLTVFEAWLRNPVEPTGFRNELLLKLFFGSYAQPAVLIEHLAAYQRRAEEEVRFLEERLRTIDDPANIAQHPHAIYLLAPMKHGIATARARIAWCKDTITALGKAAH